MQPKMAPRVKKSTKSFDDDDLKKKKTFFKQRFPGFKKKATELSVLCGNSVGFICHGPDNSLHVWPEQQDNPQALPEIIAKFNAMSDQKRRNHSCGLNDFPNLMGLSVHDLKIADSKLDSHLLGIRQQKIAVLRKTILKGSSDEDQKLVKLGMESNLKDVVSEDLIRGNQQSTTRKPKPNLTETLDKDLMVSKDVGVSDSSRLDPSALGFPCGQYFSADPTPVTHNLGVCADYGDLYSSLMDFEFPSPHWTGSDYDPLLGEATDSLTYQIQGTDYLGAVF